MAEFFGRGGFEDRVAALENTMSGAAAMTAAFTEELRGMQATVHDAGKDVGNLSRGISSGLKRAIDGLVLDGDKLSDAFRKVGQSMIDAAYSAALKPVTSHVGKLLGGGLETLIGGLLPFEKGASFSQGRVVPFATGGVVTGPVSFPMRGARGLMGEAGPEAIMPLARGADGRLGVQSQGASRPINVVMNVSTPDVQSFERSKSQIAAQVGRAIGRGQRNR